ncbi:hypothetical protein, partial [Arthrobacter sp. ISL-5]|uniref:hypothetical protein n=1 Tax=Arthrobacter sp. ISL-5 TaxID=2819111 RepID=UPI001BEBDA9B
WPAWTSETTAPLTLFDPRTTADLGKSSRSFKTDIGRGRFTVSPLEYLTPPDGHLVLPRPAKEVFSS